LDLEKTVEIEKRLLHQIILTRKVMEWLEPNRQEEIKFFLKMEADYRRRLQSVERFTPSQDFIPPIAMPTYRGRIPAVRTVD